MILIFILVLCLAFLIGEVAVRQFVKFEEEHYYRFDKINKLYRRKPHFEGPWHKRNVKGYFKLNNEGWNSTRDYFKEKKKDTYRIACIGTSETGSYQVHVEDAWPKILENKLNNEGIKCEVYTFAADRSFGYPHALHLTRYVVKDFSPDLIIYDSNFSDDSLYGTTDKNHYMLLDVDNKGNVKEIPPVNDRLPIMGQRLTLKNLIFQSKLIKYLRPKLALGTKLRRLLKLIKNMTGKPKKVVINSSRTLKTNSGLSFNDKTLIVIHYCLAELKKIQENNQLKMLFSIPVLRSKGFNWSNIIEENTQKNIEFIRSQKRELLDKYNFPYYDLTEAYNEDYAKNNKKFDYLLDPHQNKQGNFVEGEAIANFLLQTGFFETKKEIMPHYGKMENR